VGKRQYDEVEGEIRVDGRLATGINAILWRCKEGEKYIKYA
jgi:hypothetical protein